MAIKIAPYFNQVGLPVEPAPQIPQGGEVFAQASEQLLRIGQKFAEEETARLSDDLYLKALKDFYGFKKGLQERTDYSSWAPEYEEFANNWKQENYDGLDANTINAMDGQINRLIFSGSMDVDDMARTRQIDVGRASLVASKNDALTMMKSDPGKMGVAAYGSYMQRLDNAEKSHLVTSEWAAEERGRWQAEWKDIQLNALMYSNPEGFKEVLYNTGATVAAPSGGADFSPTAGNESLPRGVRNNNPGNIKKTGSNWQGEVAGSDPTFKTFATPEDGLYNMGSLLLKYQDDFGLNTITGIINRWAPSSENDPTAYSGAVAKAMGVGPNDQINLRDPSTLAALMAAMIQVENGQQPYSGNQIVSGAAAALGVDAETVVQSEATPDGSAFGLSASEVDTWVNRTNAIIRERQAAAQIQYEPMREDHLGLFAIGKQPDSYMNLNQHVEMYGKELGKLAYQEYERAREFGQQMSVAVAQPNNELDAWVKSLEVDPSKPNVDEQAAKYNTASQIREKALELRKEDAAYAATLSSPVVENAYTSFVESGDPNLLVSAINASLKEQERLGIPLAQRKPLIDSAASAMADLVLKEETAEDKLQTLASITTDLQDDGVARMVLTQLSDKGVPAQMAWALEAYRRGDRTAAVHIATVLFGEPMKTDGEAAKDIKKQMAQYDNGVGQVMSRQAAWLGSPETFQMAQTERDLVQQVATMLQMGGMSASDAVMAATKEVTGGAQPLISKNLAFVKVPSDLDVAVVESGLYNLRENIGTLFPRSEFDKIVDIGADVISDDMYADLIDDLKNDARWVDVEGGYALAMPALGGLSIMTKADGSPIQFTYEEVVKAGAIEGPNRTPGRNTLQ